MRHMLALGLTIDESTVHAPLGCQADKWQSLLHLVEAFAWLAEGSGSHKTPACRIS